MPLVYWLPRSECRMAPLQSGYARQALSSVCTHNVAFIFVDIASPSTAESKQSNIADTYNFPSRALISVISVTHFSSGALAVKSRFNRSSDLRLSRSDLVMLFGFRLGVLHRPIWFMTRYTVLSLGICTPLGCLSASA